MAGGGKRVEATEVMSGDDLGKALRVGRYKVEKKLGSGGMADIFLARAEGPGGFEKQVVIKKIRAQLGRNHKFVEMFLREARLTATLDHPNIVRIIELGEQEGEYFLALEYLDGLPVRDVVERYWHAKRALPIETLLRIMADAARGLEHAHNAKDARGHPANLVHRDVSPDNLFVTTTGATKVLDFGIAKREGIDMLTQAGEIKGKIPFMSPEALQGYPLDRRCDVWSMGIILYWMCAGRRPFDGASDLHTMKAVLEDELPPLREQNPKVPKAVDDIVRACLHKDRDKRMKTAGALADALGKVVASTKTVPPPQQLVAEAMKLEGVEWEVRPKGPAVVPAAEWVGSAADPTTLPPSIPPGDPEGTFVVDAGALAKEIAKQDAKQDAGKPQKAVKEIGRDAIKDPWKDTPKKEPAREAKSPESKSGSSARKSGRPSIAASPNARVRKLDLDTGEQKPSKGPSPNETVAELRPDLRPDTKSPGAGRKPDAAGGRRAPEKPLNDPSWDGPSMPDVDGGRGAAADLNAVTDENMKAPGDASDFDAPAHTTFDVESQRKPLGNAPLFALPPSTDPPPMPAAPPASGGPMAALLGVVVALVVAGGIVVALGLHKQLLARLGVGAKATADAGVVTDAADAGVAAASDAGVRAATDAGSAAIATPATPADAGKAARADAGIHFAEVDAGIEMPDPSQVLRTVELTAPDYIEWRNVNGESLFSGSAETRVRLSDEALLALDTRTGCTVRVAIKGKKRIEWSLLPRGKLMVKAKKGADIFLGGEKIGTAPMKAPVDLVAGSCELRTKLKGDETKQPIELKPGRTMTIAVQ